MPEFLDARGVPIVAGDVVIYGFGVGRSVAMAEGKVLGDLATGRPSTTASGRIRIHVIRRSYASGEKRMIDIAADRVVVLKRLTVGNGFEYALPDSLLAEQADEARAKFQQMYDHYALAAEATEAPAFWSGSLESYVEHCRDRVVHYRRKLEKLDA